MPNDLHDNPLYKVMSKLAGLTRDLVYQRYLLTDALNNIVGRAGHGMILDIDTYLSNAEGARLRAHMLYHQIDTLVEVLGIVGTFGAEQAQEVRGVVSSASMMFSASDTITPFSLGFPLAAPTHETYYPKVEEAYTRIMTLFFEPLDVEFTMKLIRSETALN